MRPRGLPPSSRRVIAPLIRRFPALADCSRTPSTPRTPQSRESHRLNGTLTRLNSECLRTKFFRLFWDKSWVGRFASYRSVGIAKYATRPVPCVKPPLYWHFDAPKITAHGAEDFKLRWDKSCVYKKAEIPCCGIPASYLSAQSASIFICFFSKYCIFQTPVIAAGNSE